MGTLKGYDNLERDTEVLEKDGKFYLRVNPNYLYGTREEDADKESEILKKGFLV